jgi:hypothetical protein
MLPPTSNPQLRLIQPWCDKINKESNDRLKCQIYPTMQLGGTPPQLVDQVRDGVVDLTFTLPGYTADRFPRTEVFEVPFLHTNALTLALQDYAGEAPPGRARTPRACCTCTAALWSMPAFIQVETKAHEDPHRTAAGASSARRGATCRRRA